MKKIALKKVVESLPEKFDIKIMTYVNGGELLVEGQRHGKTDRKLVMFFGTGGGFKRQVSRRIVHLNKN